ncbi:MAG: hypothetical protein K0R48_1165 [Gammaproteobacteria bacterium]|nr:hypothetical protein [Gammaproteobacteria bacterium]
MPNQVYTIDSTSGQLPDYTGTVEGISEGVLPDSHFDIIYFEGMNFGRDEKASARASLAFKAVLPSLKETGLILYHQQEEPFTNLVMKAKSGEITQEKLDLIPDCVRKSVRRQFDDMPLMKIIAPGANQITLLPKLRITSQDSGQEKSRSPTPRHGP